MSTDANKDLVRRYYEEVVNTGNVDVIARFIAPEYTEIHDNVRHVIDLAGAVEHVRGVRRTYPDLYLTVEQQIAEGEWVVTRVTMRGTHQGEWLGIKPTGKRIEVTAVNIDRVVDGRIVEHGGAANLLGPLVAVGAIQVVGGEDATPVSVVQRFVAAINARDIEGIAALMTEEHRFVDSMGQAVVGREAMRYAWEAYFRMVPDYHVDIHETFTQGPDVVLLGIAGGTYAPDGTLRTENVWWTPAAWRALVRDEHVAEWQVYADNEPMRRLMSAHPGRERAGMQQRPG